MKITLSDLIIIFEENQGIVQTKTLRAAGVTPYYIRKFENEGLIERIKQGVYRYIGEELPEIDGLAEVSRMIPNGVVCLMSAAAYYNLLTNNPESYYIALERTHHRPVLPKYPSIELYYFSKFFYQEGIETAIVNEVPIKIYSLEKTICDLIRYRSKIGKDIVLECFKSYMKSPNRNIENLMECAEKLKVAKILKRYLEFL